MPTRMVPVSPDPRAPSLDALIDQAAEEGRVSAWAGLTDAEHRACMDTWLLGRGVPLAQWPELIAAARLGRYAALVRRYECLMALLAEDDRESLIDPAFRPWDGGAA